MYCYTATTIRENLKSGFNIYPNPFTDHFVIKQIDVPQRILCSLSDCYGNIRAKWLFGYQNYKFDTTHLLPGFYILNLLNDEGSFSMSVKLIKL